jgi:hypothetical protein
MREEIGVRYGVLENENDPASSLVRTWQDSELWRRAEAILAYIRRRKEKGNLQRHGEYGDRHPPSRHEKGTALEFRCG